LSDLFLTSILTITDKLLLCQLFEEQRQSYYQLQSVLLSLILS